MTKVQACGWQIKPNKMNPSCYKISLLTCGLLIVFVAKSPAQPRATDPDLTIKVVSEPYYPIIHGQTSNDVIIARQVTTVTGGVGYVFCEKNTGQAIVSGSTNNICLYNGKLLTAAPCYDRMVFIGISESIGTNTFSVEMASSLASRALRQGATADNPHGRLVDVKPLLQSENMVAPASGQKLNNLEMSAEEGHLVLHFESHDHNGRVLFDDQLNPFLMEVTPKPNPSNMNSTHQP